MFGGSRSKAPFGDRLTRRSFRGVRASSSSADREPQEHVAEQGDRKKQSASDFERQYGGL
jgi:hypothetical protein